ncbi:MAG: hypothetical protein RI952_525 [Bacteroidota bacterium]|jgi:hypothetical protein
MKSFFVTIFLLFGLFICSQLSAQTLPPIQLDRPDQTECPFITPINYIQAESGFNIENTNSDRQILTTPTVLWKYGINKKFELRFITEMITDKNNSEKFTGLAPVTFGFKTALIEEKGIIPKTSFIGHITTATMGSEKFQTKYIAPSFRFTMQHTISDKMVLAYNLGAKWNGESAAETYLYTLTTGFSITEKLGLYTELYGFKTAYMRADHRFDGGFTYLVNDDFMADISGGFKITANGPKNYISLGLSYRMKAIN